MSDIAELVQRGAGHEEAPSDPVEGAHANDIDEQGAESPPSCCRLGLTRKLALLASFDDEGGDKEDYENGDGNEAKDELLAGHEMSFLVMGR